MQVLNRKPYNTYPSPINFNKDGKKDLINEGVWMTSEQFATKQDVFPRLKSAFTLKADNNVKFAFDRENSNYIDARKRLIIEVLTNLRGKISRRERRAIMLTNLLYSK